MSQQLHPFVNPDISQLGLIKASLQTKEISWHGYVTKKVLLAEYLYIMEINSSKQRKPSPALHY